MAHSTILVNAPRISLWSYVDDRGLTQLSAWAPHNRPELYPTRHHSQDTGNVYHGMLTVLPTSLRPKCNA